MPQLAANVLRRVVGDEEALCLAGDVYGPIWTTGVNRFDGMKTVQTEDIIGGDVDDLHDTDDRRICPQKRQIKIRIEKRPTAVPKAVKLMR